MFNKVRNIAVAVLLLAFVDLTIQADLFEGSICTLHTGELGVCKNLNTCKWLEQNIQKKKMKFSDINRCLFTERNEDIICCGDEHPNKPNKITAPCDMGEFLFDSFNCESPTVMIQTPETPPAKVPDVEPKISGTKIKNACAEYTKIATPFYPSSIVNGLPAELTEFPHMVALGYVSEDNNTEYAFDCGATLIADNWVVTAAHCIKDRYKPVVVRMGKVSLHSDDDGADIIDRPVTATIRHPKYSFSRKKNDIALVKFSGSVEYNDFVRPACINTDTEDVSETQELIIAGWGSIEPDRTIRPEFLLKGNVSTIPLDRCNQTLVTYNKLANQPSLRALSDSQMCALNPIDKRDACQGDSGGPLFYNDRFKGLSTVVGIVSFGISCGSDLPGVYTRIASFTDWIENTVWP